MSKKVIDSVTYEWVASASKNKLYLSGQTYCQLRKELQNNYWDARPGWDSINKGLLVARFTFDLYGYMEAADDYKDVLSMIFSYETGKRPKYKEPAFLCAFMVAKRFFDTDAGDPWCDEYPMQDVERFYADKFP